MKRLILLLCLPSAVASAGTLEVAYGSIERMIVAEVLTEGGRYYLRGGPDETCDYAFVQEPRVRPDGSRLELRFLFAGRAGTEIGGRCIGAGDNFDILVSGVPRYDDGEIYLDQMRFDADNVLFEAFALLIEGQLTSRLRLPLREALASRIAAWSGVATGNVRLRALDVGAIRVGDDAIEMDADYDVSVDP